MTALTRCDLCLINFEGTATEEMELLEGEGTSLSLIDADYCPSCACIVLKAIQDLKDKYKLISFRPESGG